MINGKVNLLHLEVSNLCNAACPCCPRFFENSPNVTKTLKLGYISYETFVEWFPVEFLNKVNFLLFCGNHGDPGTNPDLAKIIDYCASTEVQKIQVHTNGGMKTTKFWSEVAHALKNYHGTGELIFSVDGLEDTNHIYRRNVKWDKLVANMKTVGEINPGRENGGFDFFWEYLVFQHNEHQIEEAKERAKEYGFCSIVFKKPVNLDDGENITPVPVYDKEGKFEYWLQPTKLDRFKPSYLGNNPKEVFKHKRADLYKDEIKHFDYIAKDPEGYRLAVEEGNKIPISPKCKSNDLYIEADGQVHPCCFVATGYSKMKVGYEKGSLAYPNRLQYLTLQDKAGFEKFNLNTYSMEQIFKNKVIHKLFYNKFNDTVEDGKPLVCIEYCGNRNALDEIFDDGKIKVSDEQV